MSMSSVYKSTRSERVQSVVVSSHHRGSIVTMACSGVLVKYDIPKVRQRPYSPNLAFCDFSSPKIKENNNISRRRGIPRECDERGARYSKKGSSRYSCLCGNDAV